MRTFRHAIILILLLSCSRGAEASLKILEGEHTVVYDIVNPRGVAFIPDYSDESFEQKVISQDEFSKRVRVTSRMAPMKTRVPFPVPPRMLSASVSRYLSPERDRQSDHPSIVRLAGDITRGSRYAHEAANAVLSWVADNLTFDASVTVPADALSALRYKRAYCVGYSNLTVALLRAAGIPARVAHGYLPPGYEWGFSKEYWGVKVNDGGFHAYLEIYYPDTGWVFSDAEHAHNFVDPFHIILRLDGMDMPGAYQGGYLEVDKATFYTIFQEEDKTVMVDELPTPREKRLGRRLDNLQHAALVSGRVTDRAGQPVPKGSVVLWKEGRGTAAPFSDGRFAASVTKDGRYRVEVKGPGFAKSSQEQQVEQGKVYTMNFTLSPGGVIKGKVLNAAGKPLAEGDVFYKDGGTSYGVSVDRDGAYKIEGLAPGSYKVSAVIGEREVSRMVQVEAGRETIADFLIK
ncbi:MAG TPA: transglutaminase domain-containing protein [Nitrospirota bacterium]|nr:transglutaminase domain-containing protein [Nitrospirota bacterium]